MINQKEIKEKEQTRKDNANNVLPQKLPNGDAGQMDQERNIFDNFGFLLNHLIITL